LRVRRIFALFSSCNAFRAHSDDDKPKPSYNPHMTIQLEERFGFLISDVGRLTGKRFDDLAKSSVDLTRAQCRVLANLAHYGDVNQARLADLLEVAPISAGRLLDRMEEGGWIERTANPNDRRERQVSMTPKAERTVLPTKKPSNSSRCCNGCAAISAVSWTANAAHGIASARSRRRLQLITKSKAVRNEIVTLR
jgi:DNA-binding MarR family transcriptional regulator